MAHFPRVSAVWTAGPVSFLLLALMPTIVGFSSIDSRKKTDCHGNSALLADSWFNLPLSENESRIDTWRLPRAAGDSVLTELSMSLNLVRRDEGKHSRWYAELRLEPADPSTIGNAFNFQRARFEWVASGGSDSVEMDWTSSCKGSGVSYFPVPYAQSIWVELPGIQDDKSLRRLRFQVWGGRY